MSVKFVFPVLCFLFALCGCEKQQATGPKTTARPVSVLTLGSSSPTRMLRMTGSLEPYREESIAFEVSGRVETVRDIGTDVEGDIVDDSQKLVQPGDVIARLDETRYQLAYDAAKLRRSAASESQAAQEIDLKLVAQTQLDQAKAQLKVGESEVVAAKAKMSTAKARTTFAQKTLRREKDLVKSGASSKETLDQAQSNYDAVASELNQARAGVTAKEKLIASYQAGVAGAKAAILFKAAQIKATKAQIEELSQGVKKAREDLDACTLRAPFTGRVTGRLVSRGAFVNAGVPVVVLTMFNPVKVSVAVSAEKNRRIRFGDTVPIRPRGVHEGQPIIGFVDQKGQVADAATRTFRIDILTRNLFGKQAPGTAEAFPLGFKTDIVIAFCRIDDPQRSVFLPTRCLLKEGGKLYVLKLPGKVNQGLNQWTTPFVPTKVEVALGPRSTMFSSFYCRELKAGTGLESGSFLVVDPKRLIGEDGKVGKAVQAVKQWLLQPGDLVTVELNLGIEKNGFYVPVQSIVTRNGKTWLFIVEAGKAKKVDVVVGGQFGEQRFISAESLKNGMKVIVKGRHYVRDGEAVSVVDGFLTR